MIGTYFKRALKWIVRGVPVNKVTVSVVQRAAVNRLAGKGVLITGGGRGLGFYMAKKLLSEGANVIITGRNEDTLRIASRDLGGCPYLRFDSNNFEEMDSFFEKAQERIKCDINCLINNAGISLHEHSYEDVTIEGFDAQFNTNIKSPYFLTQYFLKYANRRGISQLNVIFVSSERGLYGDTLPYGLTKSALNSLTRGLARKYVTKGVRVNAIAPGVTASDMTHVNKDGNLYREKSCGKRVLVPEEIAEVAAFLLSDESGCITGEIVPCNQGNHLRSDYK